MPAVKMTPMKHGHARLSGILMFNTCRTWIRHRHIWTRVGRLSSLVFFKLCWIRLRMSKSGFHDTTVKVSWNWDSSLRVDCEGLESFFSRIEEGFSYLSLALNTLRLDWTLLPHQKSLCFAPPVEEGNSAPPIACIWSSEACSPLASHHHPLPLLLGDWLASLRSLWQSHTAKPSAPSAPPVTRWPSRIVVLSHSRALHPEFASLSSCVVMMVEPFALSPPLLSHVVMLSCPLPRAPLYGHRAVVVLLDPSPRATHLWPGSRCMLSGPWRPR